MKALGIRVQIKIAPMAREPEGGARRQLPGVAGRSACRHRPDSQGAFQRYDSKQIGGQNMARVRLPQFDVLYDKLQTLPDGPERIAVFREAERIALAYMPYKNVLNRLTPRHDAKARARLPPPRVLAGLVAVRRHRRRRAASARRRPRPELMTRGIDRRRFAVGSAGLIAAAGAAAAPDNSDVALDANVLRVLFESAETGFDPAQVSDLYSYRVIAHIFEALLGYDPLAMPVRLVPLTAEAMPEVVGRLHGLDGAAAARHPLRRRPGVQGPAARARRRTTTSIRSSASTTRR